MINLENKKLNKDKLLKYGFLLENNVFTYKTPILENQFELTVTISEKKEIKTKLVEISTGDIYTLHLAKDADGTFVGQIKEEYNKILESIANSCFEKDVFKNKQTKEVINYIVQKYNDELEYLWEKFPDNAIVRRKDNKKWYVVILTINKQKLGFEEDKRVEVIDLRTEDIDNIVDEKTIFRGYHMNKKHWISIVLDESLSTEFIKKRIDISYELAKKNIN